VGLINHHFQRLREFPRSEKKLLLQRPISLRDSKPNHKDKILQLKKLWSKKKENKDNGNWCSSLKKLWKKTNAKNEQQAPERALTTFPDFRESKAPLWEKNENNKFLLLILLCMSILQKTFVYIHDTTSNKVGNYLMKLALIS
jgi:uncharacterized protein with von Willebrand factor type A (vWA) domain